MKEKKNIRDSNRVMVLDQVNIAKLDMDSPDNLLANKETIFYSMAKNAGIVVILSNFVRISYQIMFRNNIILKSK